MTTGSRPLPSARDATADALALARAPVAGIELQPGFARRSGARSASAAGGVRVARRGAVIPGTGVRITAIGAGTLALRLLLARRLRVVDHLGRLLLGVTDAGLLWSLHPPCVPGGRMQRNQDAPQQPFNPSSNAASETGRSRLRRPGRVASLDRHGTTPPAPNSKPDECPGSTPKLHDRRPSWRVQRRTTQKRLEPKLRCEAVGAPAPRAAASPPRPSVSRPASRSHDAVPKNAQSGSEPVALRTRAAG